MTVLPPRVLCADPKALSTDLIAHLAGARPFAITLGQVEVFAATGVLYIGVGQGKAELEALHSQIAQNAFDAPEPYPFHPHVTLAQDFPPAQLDAMLALARKRWQEWSHERGFALCHLSFVLGADLCSWRTVSEHNFSPNSTGKD